MLPPYTKDVRGQNNFSAEYTQLKNSPTKEREHHAQKAKEIQYYVNLYAYHPTSFLFRGKDKFR